MALKIRLARAGAKKRPFYRIVVAENTSPRDGRFVEKIGTFNPLLANDHADRVVLDTDRAKHWLSVGAKPTDRVAKILGGADIIPMPAPGNNPQKAKPKAKAQERLEAAKAAAEEKAAAAAAEAEAPAEEAAPEAPAAEEAPAEEPKAEEAAPAEEKAEEPKAEEAPAEEEKKEE